jgi:hypothetical protein
MSDRDNDQRGTRYGHRSGSGSNEPRGGEKKEQRDDWIHRQGGDQSREPDDAGRPAVERENRR